MQTAKGVSVLVTGSNGQLGCEIKDAAKKMIPSDQDIRFYFMNKNDLNITIKDSLREYCSVNNITHIMNCAAYTAVDKAESEPDLANLVNGEALKIMTDVANELHIRVYHISTDFVFDGTSSIPYHEDDSTFPINKYGGSKLLGENYLKDIISGVLIRTSWMYSTYGSNFVKTMIRLGKEKNELNVVSDQIGSPTYAKDLAEVMIQMLLVDIKTELSGYQIYHYCNNGCVSWYDFASVIMELSNSKCIVKPIKTDEYPTAAARPKYSVLDNNHIQNDYGISIPEWKDSLINCMGKLVL